MKTLNGVIVALAVCAMVGAGVIGCNTFRGAGRDIQKGGEAVTNAADNVQERHHHPTRHTISAWAERGGSISPSGATSGYYGSNRTFTIRANRGYHVADVLVDGKSVGAVSRHTFDNVTQNHTILAVFTRNPRG